MEKETTDSWVHVEALVSHLHVALLRQGPLDVVVAFGSQLNLILAARLQGETLPSRCGCSEVFILFFYRFFLDSGTLTSRPLSLKRPSSSVTVSSLYRLQSPWPTASTATSLSASPLRDCTAP